MVRGKRRWATGEIIRGARRHRPPHRGQWTLGNWRRRWTNYCRFIRKVRARAKAEAGVVAAAVAARFLETVITVGRPATEHQNAGHPREAASRREHRENRRGLALAPGTLKPPRVIIVARPGTSRKTAGPLVEVPIPRTPKEVNPERARTGSTARAARRGRTARGL